MVALSVFVLVISFRTLSVLDTSGDTRRGKYVKWIIIFSKVAMVAVPKQCDVGLANVEVKLRDTLSRFEEVLLTQTEGASRVTIPRIIHQSWKSKERIPIKVSTLL